MIVKVDLSPLSETRWSDYAVRFLFGGLITAAAGIIAKSFGPVVGGLFLAFPAIFPASATLIEKHEINQKERLGLKGTRRAAAAVSIDAAGAAMGSIGLTVFALMVWRFMPSHSPWIVLGLATLAWAAVSATVWGVRKRL